MQYTIANRITDNFNIKIMLSEDVTFLNKASIQRTLGQIPDNTKIEIDASNTHFIHPDVIEIIEDFVINAKTRDIEVKVIDLYNEVHKVPFDHLELANAGNSQR